MFCNKNCKKCNHYKELIVEIDGKPSTIHKCVFEAILDSMLRQEQANIRIQSAIESGRNEQVRTTDSINRTLANGFIAIVNKAEELNRNTIEYIDHE